MLFFRPVLSFFSVYSLVLFRHIARYAPLQNKKISSKTILKTTTSKI